MPLARSEDNHDPASREKPKTVPAKPASREPRKAENCAGEAPPIACLKEGLNVNLGTLIPTR
jgi:hypothetical protein